jgi:ATP phosphoribosyltransferase-like protein
VGEGRVDLGITGRDQVAEHEAISPPTESTGVEEVMDLGFGNCKLMVQVPEKGNIQEPKGLVGKNVVTSFVGLTERYFAKLEGIEVNDDTTAQNDDLKSKLKTKIMYVGGSVEAACALGVADGIVDLVGESKQNLGEVGADDTESGATMEAAGLKAIDTVVDSTAVLIRSKKPSSQELVDLIASRIKGVISEYISRSIETRLTAGPDAQRYVLCQYNIKRDLLSTAASITPGKRAPTVTALDDADWVAVSSMVLKKDVATVMDKLTSVGAADILVLGILNSRTD